MLESKLKFGLLPTTRIKQHENSTNSTNITESRCSALTVQPFPPSNYEYEKDVLSQGDCRTARLAIHTKRTVNGKPLTLDEIKATPIFKALFAENDCQADITGDYYLVDGTTFRVENGQLSYWQHSQLLLWQDNSIYHLTDQFEVGKVEQKIDQQPFNQQILGWIRDRLQQDSACRIDSHFYNNTFKQTCLLGLQWKDCATLSAEIHTIYSPQYQTPLTFRTPISHPKNFSDPDFEILFDWKS